MFIKISTPRILVFFTNLAIFSNFLDIYCHNSVFQPKRKSPLGFDNKLLDNGFWPWISFQLLLSQHFFMQLAIFKIFVIV